ncbi:MAG: GAF domain-containing protein, partial [Chthoniobacteraceae bacterium]
MSHPHPVTQNLDACAREPIHIPGSVQPHGALLALQEPSLIAVQASSNCGELLGIPHAELLGRDFRELLEPGALAAFEEALAAGDPARVSPLKLVIGPRAFDAVFHHSGGLLVVELEPAPPASETFARHHRQLQRSLTAMQEAEDLSGLFATIAEAVSSLTGYERVMVYRFDADWHGEVVGEVLTGDVDSYMGLHFPASDIPEQARALYAKTWLRIIPTVDYTPAVLEPPLNPLTGQPLDLSFSILRSVSPVHLEYLRNMNVGASMSISLIVHGKLWGLVACHHRTARALPYSVRAACELFGQVASAEIAASEKARRLTDHAVAKTIQTRFFDVISEEENPTDALLRYTPSLLTFMGAGGAAVCRGDQCSLVGIAPPKVQVGELLQWLRSRIGTEHIFATDHLSQYWPPAADWTESASGLLAIELSRVDSHWLLWFRPEVVKTVRWAGNPEKPVEEGLRLHPRKSFDTWQQTVTGRSLPWTDAEL